MNHANASEYLRRFCKSMLRVLEDRASRPVVEHGLPALVQALDQGSHSTVSHLRMEIRNWDAATESVRRLTESPSPLFRDEASALLEKLKATRARAIRIAEALEKLQSEVAGEFDSIRDGYAPRQVASPAVREDPIPLMPESSSPEFATPSSDLESLFAFESSRERAKDLFAQAEKAFALEDFSKAEALYTEALVNDVDLRVGFLRRGRIRLFRGRLVEAVADCDRAIELDEGDGEAFWCRGDARAIEGNRPLALADYTRALELRPDLAIVRYNRAVVMREAGMLDEALQEFDELIREEPAHAPLYLNRGLVWMARRNWNRAAAEFRVALKLQPDSLEALQRLHDAEDHAHKLTPEDIRGLRPLVEQEIPTAAVSRQKDRAAELKAEPDPRDPPQESRNTEAIATNETVPESKPAKPERVVSLEFQCPGCGIMSAVRWDKLKVGRVLGCPHCQKRFTSKLDGRIVEVVQDKNGHWADTEWRDAQQQIARSKRNRWIGLTASVAMLGFVLLSTPALVRNLAASETPLPTQLEPRAELFARAWIKGDTAMMRRLTDPVQDRMLFNWCRRNPFPKFRDQEVNVEDAKADVQVVPGNGSIATVRVRFVSIENERTHLPIEIRSSWEERGGTWSFQPSGNVKSVKK